MIFLKNILSLQRKLIVLAIIIFHFHVYSKTINSKIEVLRSQQIEIKGKITDVKGNAIFGASILEKGTNNATLSNINGEFEIKIKDKNSVLIINFLGFEQQNIKILEKKYIEIILIEDTTQLDEIVVVGYGSKKKTEVTGAITTVSTKDAKDRAVSDAAQLLQGKVSGVNIVQNSGQPGNTNSSIRIRGVSSIDNNNDPLIIIDGVPGDFNDINPNDIKSLSVLKDAASASIYGSRASAGVIIIETKNSSKGLNLDYNFLYTITQPTRLPNMVNSWEHAQLRNEARQNVGLPEIYSDFDIKEFEYGLNRNRPNTDWYDTYFQTAALSSHYLNLRGGDKKYNFSSSLTYLDQEGVLKGTNTDKLSFRTRLNGKFWDDKIIFNLNIYGDEANTHELSSSTSTILSQLASNTPTTFVISDNGAPSFAGRHLYIEDIGGGIDNQRTSLRLQGSVTIKPIKNIKAKLLYSKNRFELDYQRLLPEFETAGSIDNSFEGSLQLSSLTKDWYQTNTNQLTATVDYNYKNKGHRASFLFGYERLERDFTYDRAFVNNLSNNLPIFDFGDPSTSFLTSRATSNATVSQFGRINYSYKYRYIFNFSMRRDGSSRFADGQKYGVFPSASLGWVVDKEKFMKNTDVFKLKLRASWGRLGNQNIYTAYAASDQLSVTEFYSFGGNIVPGSGTTVLANPDTTWETTEQTDIGFDMKLYGKVTINFDYYRKTTSDILARITIPSSLGVTTLPYQNIGNMLNEGFDLDIGYKSKPNPDGLEFTINSNISYLHNEVTSLGNDLDFVDHASTNSEFGVLRSQVGSSFASFFGYKTDGLLQISDFTWQNNSDLSIPHEQRNYLLKSGITDQSSVMSNPAPGDIKLVDTNGDNIITSDDKTIIGRSIPKINYGFNINFAYKNWSLRLIGQGVAGAQAYVNGPGVGPFWNVGNGSVSRELATNRWTFENQNTSFARLYEDKVRDALVSDYNIYDADYFRMKNVTLSYSFNQQLLEKFRIKKLNVFATAENLFTITNFLDGYDPERDYRNTRGNFHPQIATMSLGFNLSF
ncbi:SusC/RagA family TonB-linked outer membrane protein [Polaribacter porphyrae]|uniref:SusC/RagA family TonB-linked outer membrane protein n=1 Tax=Polaribacter porphyrae TaxID=1137780 RepID=A0A2S7WR97_9FLAO|nr:TonB-dependent receptor [Polaribacter porphyrae]PQJ79811.1 hypothetical protein BTO18_11775 [Polaribacter porphyrae]